MIVWGRRKGKDYAEETYAGDLPLQERWGVAATMGGRAWAGTRPAPTVVALGFEQRSLTQQFQLSTMVGHTKGGVAGGIPPHKGGPKARPPKTAVVSGR